MGSQAGSMGRLERIIEWTKEGERRLVEGCVNEWGARVAQAVNHQSSSLVANDQSPLCP